MRLGGGACPRGDVPAHRYSSSTLIYAVVVAGLGVAAGAHLLLRADTSRWNPLALAVFGGFALTTALLTITLQGFRRSKGTLTVASLPTYVLIFLVDPSAVALVSTIWNTMRILGPAAAGVLIAWIGIGRPSSSPLRGTCSRRC